MKKITIITTIFAAVSVPSVVHADGNSAFAAQEARLNAAGYRLSLPRNQTVVHKTLVNGIYRVTDTKNEFQYFLTENGEFTGDSRGWRRNPESTPATLEERGQLKYEIVKNIDYDSMIKVQYGDGGQRKLLLKSALDCGYCKKMEATLAKNSKNINTTFYVLPRARDLRIDSQGRFTDPSAHSLWDAAARIMCSNDNAAAWKKYWQSRDLPPANRECKISGARLAMQSNEFDDILSSVGIKTTGTPAVVREDGRVSTPPVNIDLGDIEKSYGKSGSSDIHEAIRNNLLPIIYLKARN